MIHVGYVIRLCTAAEAHKQKQKKRKERKTQKKILVCTAAEAYKQMTGSQTNPRKEKKRKKNTKEDSFKSPDRRPIRAERVEQLTLILKRPGFGSEQLERNIHQPQPLPYPLIMDSGSGITD